MMSPLFDERTVDLIYNTKTVTRDETNHESWVDRATADETGAVTRISHTRFISSREE